MFKTIDLHSLESVTGGQCQCAPGGGQEGGDPTQQQQGAPEQGGGAMGGIQQFLAFLQSPAFTQIIGGIQQALAGGGQGQAQGQGQPQEAAPTAQA